jgi:hypothetical protein
MQINDKSLSEWTIDDIKTLIGDEQWRESSALDYKREFKARDEGFKKDVCAYANARGGYLFIGLDEDNGLATAVVGIDDIGIDDFNLSISNALASSVEPSRPEYESHVIPLGNGKCILIIRVFEGYDKPYRVRNEGRFWIRGNAGNETMSYMAIEEMFLRKNAQKDRLQQMLDTRLSFLGQHHNPPHLLYDNQPFLAFHFVPLSAVSGHDTRYPIKDFFDTPDVLFKVSDPAAAAQFKDDESKINMDGLVKYRYDEDGSGGGRSHVQLFWNGIVEAASNRSFVTAGDFGSETVFNAARMREIVPGLLRAAAGFYTVIGMHEPFSAVLSIENAAGVPVSIDEASTVNMDRVQLRTLPVRVDDIGENALREAGDALLDEFGYLIGINNYHSRRPS